MIRALSLTALLALASAGHGETRYVEGEVIVTFKASASLNTAKAALKKKSLAFSKHFGTLSAKRKKQTGLVHDGTRTTAQLLEDLRKEPDVESVEPNYLRWIKSAPDDPRFSELWALENTGQTVNGTTGTAGADIKFLEAWQRARSSSAELVVGVIDTGVDYTHPELFSNIWTNPQEIPGNNTDDDNDGYVDDVHGYDFSAGDADPWDSGDHGTHVSGTIAAVHNNHTGIAGLNDHVKIMPLKASNNGDSISTSAVISALQYATLMKTRGVNVVAINGSFGGGGFSTSERDAIDAAGEAGIIFCVAAGNESSDNNSTSTYPASYRRPNMLVVAATDQKDALASYSNFGSTTVDLAAPGSNILSTKPSTMLFEAGGSNYTAGELTFTGRTNNVTGAIIFCGLGYPEDFPAAVNGNIALIERGTLNFSVKVQNAMDAGAKAAIIYNREPGSFLGTLQTAGDWIPSLSITQADGLAIKAALPLNGSVKANGLYQFENGTSMATPHVAGAVAFAAMCFPNETMAQRRQRILSAVDVKASLQSKTITGGRLNLLSVITGGVNSVQPWPYITNSEDLTGGAVGQVYSHSFTVSGGTQPYSFSVASGALPDGITLSTAGTLSGTPTTAGTSEFTVLVSDSTGPGAGKAFTLVIAAAPVSITTSGTLSNGSVGSSYSTILEATGGTTPYTWTVVSGALPSGMTLSSGGSLSGTPSTDGPFNFTAKVTDANGLNASRAFSFSIIAAPITITTPSLLPGAVVGVNYLKTLAATGGTSPYTWALMSGGLPAGIVLSSSGVLVGTPTGATSVGFTLEATDSDGKKGIHPFTLNVTATYQVPVVNPPGLGSITIGTSFNATVTATNYPKSFTMTGLPKGLTYVAATGVISGRPQASGVFNVQIKASNKAGTSAAVSAPLVVTSLAKNLTGSFTGPVARDSAANLGLGGRLTLTVTTTGWFTAKIAYGTVTRQAVGYLSATAPQISAPVDGRTLSLTLDPLTGLVIGTHGDAAVNGWRQTWNALSNPADKRAGYYSIGIDLADSLNDGVASIPQGTGYAAFTVSNGGTFTLAGKTADNQAMSSSGFMGPGGQMLVYQVLNGSKGSVHGALTLAVDPESSFLDNSASGVLTWLKPPTTSRAYGAGFGPINLNAAGKYLAPSSKGVVLGLPDAGTAGLSFYDGGLNLAEINPDLSGFIYTDKNSVVVPAAGSNDNPGRVKLAINKSTGAVTGSFTLAETSPVLKRTVSFYGMIVRPASGASKAVGWFLLPQIPATGQTIKNSPMLSGKVVIEQAAAP